MKAVLGLLFICLSFSVHAGDNLYGQSYRTCMDRSDGVTAEIHDCIGEEHARQDARLNKAYRSLVAQLSADRKKELLAAQRLWIQYRDANCQFYADPDAGTLAAIGAASCGLEMTTRRASELEALAR